MAIRTGKEKKVKNKDREVEYESIQDEIVREREVRRAAGTTRTFVRGNPKP